MKVNQFYYLLFFSNCTFSFLIRGTTLIKVYKQQILLFVIISFTIGQLTAVSAPIYGSIRDSYLRSFDLGDDVAIISPEEYKKQHKKLELQDERLSHRKKREVAFSMLVQEGLNVSQNNVIGQNFIRKLDLLVGAPGSEGNNLMGAIDHTTTVFGQAALARMLVDPTADIQILKQRQAIVQELLNNPALRSELEALVMRMHGVEDFLLGYWANCNPINDELFKDLYWGNWASRLNNSTVGLEVGTRLRNAKNLLQMTWYPLIQILKPAASGYYNELQKTQDQNLSIAYHLKQGLNHCVQGTKNDINPFPKLFKNGLNFSGEFLASDLTLGDNLILIEHMLLQKNKDITPNMMLAIKVVFGLNHYYSIGSYFNSVYLGITDEIEKTKLVNYLQQKLIGVADYIDCMRQLVVVMNNNPVLSGNMQLIDQLDAALNHNEHNGVKSLLNMLNHNTFKGNPSFFSLTGRVLAAHTMMKDNKDGLIKALEAAGEIDAYLAIAKLFERHQNTPARYSFVEFIENDAPYVQAVNFWNPFISAEKVVVNNLTLGATAQPNNMILTGPNTGGKSTVLKAFILNMLLAQTIGIAPVDKLVMTPFSAIACHINITDDIAGGKSLFAAEVERAKEALSSIRSLKPHEFSILILDEVFNSTSPKEGEEAAIRFVQQLAGYQNSMCIIATHFARLTELEESNSNLFKNYQVQVIKREDGSLYRPYKLETGKTFLSVAFDILKEEGVFADDMFS